jgi:hypothetical protein
MWRRIRRHEQRTRQREARSCAQARQPVRQQRTETVAEEHMRTVQLRPELTMQHLHQLAQRREALTVLNLDRNHLDARTERPTPGVEHRPSTAGVVKAEQPHRLTRLPRLLELH